MTQQLKKAMDYLTNRYSMDWYKVAVEYAKKHPTSFNRTLAKVAPDAWVPDALLQPNKIAAIKYVRSQTGWGLKEAKEWCDNNWREHA